MQRATSINWKKLINSIRNQECILVLGSNMASVNHHGQFIPIAHLLAEKLAKELHRQKSQYLLYHANNLAYLAKELEDAYLPQCNFSREKARSKVGAFI